MKKLLTTLPLVITLLVSTEAVAHTGHFINNSVHSFLHIEHIVTLIAIGLAVFLLKEFRGK